MIRLLKYSAVYIFLSVMAGCTSQERGIDEKVLPVPLAKGLQTISADSIFESAEYIALETTEANLLSGLESLSVRLQQDTLYIWDRHQQELSQYDERGRYLQKLSRRGNGPGEYISVSDFVVLDTMVCLLAGANKKIMFYRKSDFSYLYSIPSPINGVKMNKYGEFLYLFSGNWSPEKYNIYVIDLQTGAVVGRYHKFDTGQTYYTRTTFNRCEAYNYYFMAYDYHIYEALPTEGRVVYRLDFGTDNMFDEQFLSMSDKGKRVRLKELYSDFSSLKNRKIDGIDNLYLSDKMIFFTFLQGVSGNWYLKRKDSSPLIGYPVATERFPLVSPSISYMNGNYVYELKMPDRILWYEDNYEKMRKSGKGFRVPDWLLSKIKFDDNPVLCRYKLKK